LASLHPIPTRHPIIRISDLISKASVCTMDGLAAGAEMHQRQKKDWQATVWSHFPRLIGTWALGCG